MDTAILHRLRTFLAVAENLSFSRAARQLVVSQPFVSRQVKELEQIVGCRLFERKGRRISMTEAGQAFFLNAVKVRESLQELESSIHSFGDGLAGLLQLGGSSAWEYLLPEHMGTFKRAYPRISVALTVGGTAEIIQHMLDSRIHLGFVPLAPRESQIEAIWLTNENLAIVGAPSHALADGRRHPPGDLKHVPFVAGIPGAITEELADRYLQALGVERAVAMRLGSHEAIKQAVRAGVGVAILSRYALLEELGNGALVEVHLDAPPCTRPLYAIRNRSTFFSPAQQAFLAHLNRALGQTSQEEASLSSQ